MKSQERHKLKTNELAESLSKLPEYFETHGKNLLMWIVIVAAVVIGLWFWWGQRVSQQREISTKMMDVLLQKQHLQQMAVMHSRDVQQGETYDPDSIAVSFASMAQLSSNKEVSITALLQQAQVIHSKIHYSDWPMTEEQRIVILDQAQAIYEKLIQMYPNSVTAQGGARLGLGIIAEDRGEWQKAKDSYMEIITEKDGKFSGTIFPKKAQSRLDLIDDISDPIEFIAAPIETSDETLGPVEESKAAENSLPDLDGAQNPDNAGQSNAEGQ